VKKIIASEFVTLDGIMDKFGLSWADRPGALYETLQDPDREEAGRVMQPILQMKKIRIAQLRKAHHGR
jgi:predicted 3-demethylubiquinone-9 3-methyltransferase (glyoxalase superfamily)